MNNFSYDEPTDHDLLDLEHAEDNHDKYLDFEILTSSGELI